MTGITDLVNLARKWMHAGRPPQAPTDYGRSRNVWLKKFPKHEEFLSTLPSLLDRHAVRQVVADLRFTPEERFLTTMAWGYGGVGYGPYRVEKMLGTPAVSQLLTKSWSLAKSGSSLGAYEFLMNNRIRQLGPAFASKWLYFCGPEEIAAPIYDSVVAKWVMTNAKEFFADVPISSEYWSPATYSRFLAFLNEASSITGCSRGELEYLIFLDQSAEFQF